MEQPATLEGFFHEAVDQALKENGVEASTLTEHYLVQLLATYASQSIDDTPLGVKLLEALGATPRERRERLREVGDTSLFVSGFWSDSFSRRAVDVDYYIDLGGSAYGELARSGAGWRRDPNCDVYGALAENFPRFVDVLALISRRIMPPASPQDIVKLYERWLRTRSHWAARRLAAVGVVPQSGGGTRLQ
jgi:hypothetical protein